MVVSWVCAGNTKGNAPGWLVLRGLCIEAESPQALASGGSCYDASYAGGGGAA